MGKGNDMKKYLSIEGMSCKHCVNRVKKYLETVGTDVSVDLEGKKADFNAGSDVDIDKTKNRQHRPIQRPKARMSPLPFQYQLLHPGNALCQLCPIH